jgi:hypothetical protein
VTLSVAAVLQLRRPRFLRGMLPYGVRTFLQRIFRLTSDHLPSTTNLPHSPQNKTANNANGTGYEKFGDFLEYPRNERFYLFC